MKNNIIYRFKNKIKLEIKGKNINRFIMRLNKNKIEILKCTHIDKDTINIIIYKKDYQTIEKLKTIYNITELDTYGLIKIKKKIYINRYLIISLILGYILLIVLSNIIFEIEIIDNDYEMRNLLKKELREHGIKEKNFKKNYQQIENIKQDILNKYRDKIEWLEIENKGTKYIVRIEQRKKAQLTEQLPNRNIVASKEAIIKEIKALNGQIIKEKNNYVKKGDIIISGNIKEGENIKKTIPAEGKVYGEVWYEISISYPYVYLETKKTSNEKDIYTIKILNKNIELFNFKPYKNKMTEEKIILKNSIFPISLLKEHQTEIIKIEQILTTDEALQKALEKGIQQIKNNLDQDEYIINYKVLNTNIKENELDLKIFFSVYENITGYENIENDELNIE